MELNNLAKALLSNEGMLCPEPVLAGLRLEGITTKGAEKPKSSRLMVNISSTSSFRDEIEKAIEGNCDTFEGLPVLRLTDGVYYIRYDTKFSNSYNRMAKKYKLEEPFKIKQDLTGFGCWIAGPKHFNALCDEILEYNFLRNCTTFSDELFAIAKANPGVNIPFCLDMAKLHKEKSYYIVPIKDTDSRVDYFRSLNKKIDYDKYYRNVVKRPEIQEEMRCNRLEYEQNRH